jgi:ribulose bisphosphate carboxylase small subunit
MFLILLILANSMLGTNETKDARSRIQKMKLCSNLTNLTQYELLDIVVNNFTRTEAMKTWLLELNVITEDYKLPSENGYIGFEYNSDLNFSGKVWSYLPTNIGTFTNSGTYSHIQDILDVYDLFLIRKFALKESKFILKTENSSKVIDLGVKIAPVGLPITRQLIIQYLHS